MRVYAILAVCLVIGVSGDSGGGKMENISNEAECTAVGGSCFHRNNCTLTKNVFQDGCRLDLYGCCISKAIVCESKNGRFTTDEECEAKSGFRVTGLHLDNKGCCAPFENGHGNGDGDGNGQGQGQGKGNGQSHGQGGGHGNAQGQDQGNGNGHGQGQGNGNGHGQGQGNGNGQEGGQGNGQGHGNGNGQGQGSGRASGQGQDYGNRQGHGTGDGQRQDNRNGTAQYQTSGTGADATRLSCGMLVIFALVSSYSVVV